MNKKSSFRIALDFAIVLAIATAGALAGAPALADGGTPPPSMTGQNPWG